MRTFRALLRRADDIIGVPFAELAPVLGISWSGTPEHRKRLSGEVVELALGLKANSKPEPDMRDLNLEVKTIPITDDLAVREHTKVTSLNPQDTVRREWENSVVYHKLRSTLFVPVVKFELEQPDRWYIRSPFIWLPSGPQMEQLKADYQSVRELLAAGRPEEVSSAEPPDGQGKFLMANTAGKDSADTTKFEVGGKVFQVKRRAWMLRKSFTRTLVAENVGYAARMTHLDEAT